MLLLPPVASNHMVLDRIDHCDVMTYLRSLPDRSVNCVITSPPYFGLRDYEVDGQIGSEPTPAEYIAIMVALFSEVKRVLRDDGTLWLNIGDAYANDTKWGGKTSGKHAKGLQGTGFIGRGRTHTGLPSKSLMMMPARVAIALQDDGWILRSEIVWNKSTCLPESVQDRPTKSHEMVYLFAKTQKYFCDMYAIREPAQDWGSRDRSNGKYTSGQPPINGHAHGGLRGWESDTENLTKNKRSVWTVAPKPTPIPHFATFPPKLIEPMVIAGCPSSVCSACGEPYRREVIKEFIPQADVSEEAGKRRGKLYKNSGWKDVPRGAVKIRRGELKAHCQCGAAARPGIVLDPFMGSGTTARVAKKHGRNWIGCDLNAEYIRWAYQLLDEEFEAPLLQEVSKIVQMGF